MTPAEKFCGGCGGANKGFGGDSPPVATLPLPVQVSAPPQETQLSLRLRGERFVRLAAVGAIAGFLSTAWALSSTKDYPAASGVAFCFGLMCLWESFSYWRRPALVIVNEIGISVPEDAVPYDQLADVRIEYQPMGGIVRLRMIRSAGQETLFADTGFSRQEAESLDAALRRACPHLRPSLKIAA